jgi:hypothetical protein
MDAVMVYLGAPDAADFAPAPHSFVNALDFPGPAALAAFLRALAADPARYDSYLAWKRGPGPVRLSQRYRQSVRSTDRAAGVDSVPCRLCRLVGGEGGAEGDPEADAAGEGVRAAEAVGEESERASGDDFRIELFEGSGGSVAGVREGGEAGFVALLVHSGERGVRHEDLAADFQR